jgi:RES domain-containing protein|tara:strand:- start:1150 stop:1608 length:459 start_codon:yes stop_codon:yes gene_type:complete
MRVFRLSKLKYAQEFNGKGAAKFGNRWNSKGVEIIYTAESRALAMAEVVVHVSLATLPKDFVMIEIDIPESLSFNLLKSKDLREDWNSHPHTSHTQQLGDDFVDSKDFCVCKVPSAVVKGDFNYLINPHHKDAKRIKIKSVTTFPFDKIIFS